MAKTITLEVARYRPEQEAEPTFESFEVPLNDDWVVLDALNHIKDKLDGSLSYRWSCRMGVCGSCGMMVNGDPKLTCATFLTAYAPGPIRVEPVDDVVSRRGRNRHSHTVSGHLPGMTRGAARCSALEP